MDLSRLKNKISDFPTLPGVYVFFGVKKEVLYIGKATNLRSRVQSYFRGVIPDLLCPSSGGIRNPEILKQVQYDKKRVANVANRPIEMMIRMVADVEFQQTDSVLEALILESNLIKKHQPKYNVDLKDDKSFAYFVITKEEFPRVLIFRRTDVDFKNLKTKNYELKTIYGPYTSKYQMEIALKIIRRIFPFHSNKAKTEKGCLDFQLGRCPGPYADAISKEDYKKNIRGIRMILEGKKKRLITTLEKEMREAAKKNEFEKAGEIRNKIFALQHIRDIALMGREFESELSDLKPNSYDLKPVRIEAYDISNISGKQAVGSMVVFAGKNPDKSQYRKFKIKSVEGPNDVAMMREVLARRIGNDWPRPDLVLLDGGQGHLNAVVDLFEVLNFEVAVVSVAKGESRKNLNFQFPISNQVLMSKFSKEITELLEDKNFVKHIMDEAHRFAIAYHKKRRRKEMLE